MTKYEDMKNSKNVRFWLIYNIFIDLINFYVSCFLSVCYREAAGLQFRLRA